MPIPNYMARWRIAVFLKVKILLPKLLKQHLNWLRNSALTHKALPLDYEITIASTYPQLAKKYRLISLRLLLEIGNPKQYIPNLVYWLHLETIRKKLRRPEWINCPLPDLRKTSLPKRRTKKQINMFSEKSLIC